MSDTPSCDATKGLLACGAYPTPDDDVWEQLARTLERELAAALVDAERYRWMRNHGGCPFAETDPCWESPDAFDADVDAARKGE